MIRLLFVPFFALVLFSCEDSSKEIDPLFYQISERDSTRCMNEILDGILAEAREDQRIADHFYNPSIAYCGVYEVFRIVVNNRGDLMINLELDSANVSKKTYQYFMCNRNLTSEETTAASMDPGHFGFDFPFYNRFDPDEIERKIEETTEEWGEVKNTDGVEPEFVDFFASKVEEWKLRKRALEIIGTSSLSEVSFAAHVRFEYQKTTNKSKEVSKEIAFAFYQMRNYECMRYFKETYLSLYDRAQRTKKSKDQEKLSALELLHPASIYFEDGSKPRPYEMIPPPPELHEDFTP